MAVKIILLVLFGILTAFVAYRFGFLGKGQLLPESITQLAITPNPTPTPAADLIIPTVDKQALTLTIVDGPNYATASQKFAIAWLVETQKIATTSHTAIHFGPISKADPKLTSDYPEKSEILKGTIPASFSAQLKIPTEGLYYYRALAIVGSEYFWSEEKRLRIFAATSAALSR